MRSTLGPSGAHDYDEPARPSWTFQQRIPVQAEKAEADDLPDDQPAALGPASAVSPALVELGEAHFWPHARAAGDLSSPGAVKIVTRGDGVWVYDQAGSRYFDTLSGMWLANIGHGRREVADAVHAQIRELGYAPDGTVHPTTLRLAARVAALAPDPASRVFFTSGGSEAVETAMKMAKKFHRNRGEAGRYKFISRRGSYHGATHGCLSLGGGGSNNGAEYGPLPYRREGGMTTQRLKTYVVNLKRRADRRARMEHLLPAAWDVQFTSDWDGPTDGQAIDPGDLPGFGLHPWEIPSDNPWWSRPLKLGEIGCAISHWMCWQRAAADGADPALILEDDVVLTRHCAERLQARLTRLSAIDPRWDLIYLGRWALDGEDRPVTAGIVRPGYSYCTYGYLLSPSGLRAMLTSGFERALIPVDELIPALYMDHPREDIRSLYPKRLRAYALEPALVTQLPKDEAGSDTEASAFAPSSRLQPDRGGM